MKRSLFVLIAVAGLLLSLFGMQSQAEAQGGDDPADIEPGKALYEMNCAGCHAVDGTGVAGQGRPLIGIATEGDRATHIASVTDGKGGMPAFGDLAPAEAIGQAVSYVRLTFVEEAAASTSATDELAITGVGSTGLAVVGVAMLAGGMQLVMFSKRREA